MHSYFDTEELLLAVCSHLQPKELLNFALTCSRFMEPALNTLWRTSSIDLASLVQLFPGDAWEVTEGGSFFQSQSSDHGEPVRQFNIVASRPFSASDWASIARYTPYVFNLHFRGTHHNIHHHLLNSAAFAFDGDTLFPNLQRLDLSGLPVDSYLPFMNIVLSPTLNHLTLSFNGNPEALTVLSRLSVICPSIISFECKFSGIDVDEQAFKHALSHAITNWKRIEEVTVPVLTAKAVRHLSRLPNFRSLSVLDYSRFGLEPFSSLHGFKSIRRLRFDVYFPQHILDFFRSLETSVLGEIEIICDRVFFNGSWEEFFTALVQCSSLAETLSVTVMQSVLSPGIATLGLQVDDIRPLLMAQNLVCLDLPNFDIFDLSDDFIEELAKSSPQLVRLVIWTVLDVPAVPTLTLNAYLHVLRHCPELKALGLVVDTTGAGDWVHDKPGEGWIKPRGSEFTLFVGGCKIKSPPAVAAFLSAFFDEAIKIVVPRRPGEGTARAWSEVESLLPLFVNVRLQEQRCMRRN